MFFKKECNYTFNYDKEGFNVFLQTIGIVMNPFQVFHVTILMMWIPVFYGLLTFYSLRLNMVSNGKRSESRGQMVFVKWNSAQRII